MSSSSFSIAYNFIANNASLIKAAKENMKVLNEFKQNALSFSNAWSQTWQNAGQKMVDFGKNVTMKLGLPTSIFTGFALKSFMELEMVENKFNTFFGKDAPQALQFTQKYAQASAYGFQELANMMIIFKQQQRDIGLTDMGVMGATKGVGDVLLAYANTKDERERAMYALQQVGMYGRLRAGELMQFTNANIPIMNILSRQTGQTSQQLQKMMGDGKLTMQLLLEALLKESRNPIIETLLANRRKSLTGQWDSFKESFDLFKAEFGRLLNDGLKLPQLLNKAATHLQKATEYMKQLSPEMKTFIGMATLFTVVLGPALVVLGLFKKSFVTLGKIAKDVLFTISYHTKTAQTGMSGFFATGANGFKSLLTGASRFIAGLFLIQTAFTFIKGMWEGFSASFKSSTNEVQKQVGLWMIIKDIISIIGSTVNLAFEGIKAIGNFLGMLIGKLLNLISKIPGLGGLKDLSSMHEFLTASNKGIQNFTTEIKEKREAIFDIKQPSLSAPVSQSKQAPINIDNNIIIQDGKVKSQSTHIKQSGNIDKAPDFFASHNNIKYALE